MSAKSMTTLAISLLALLTIQAADIQIINGDDPAVGLNDMTSATPVGGNSGTTLGAQRRNVFLRAAEIWSDLITNEGTIQITVTSQQFGCNNDGQGGVSAVLAFAGPTSVSVGFPNAPLSNTAYPTALVNCLTGSDADPNNTEISATMNISLDSDSACDPFGGWYYGFDHNAPGTTDLLDTILHEIGHGLGFIDFSDHTTGELLNIGGTNYPDCFNTLVRNSSTGKNYPNMTAAERRAADINDPHLVWTGAAVTAQAENELDPMTTITATIDHKTRQWPVLRANFGTDSFPSHAHSLPVTADQYDPASKQIDPALDLAGKIVIMPRGVDDFAAMAWAAQKAGAQAIIIADPTRQTLIHMLPGAFGNKIQIPAFFIAGNGAETLLQHPTADVAFSLSKTDRQGMNGGFVRLYAPNQFQTGSSFGHWTPDAFPNLLMEPFATGDTVGDVDLTDDLLKDLGYSIKESASTHQLIYPWISNRDGQFRSTLVANNLSGSSQTVTLTALREDGASATTQRTIAANGFLAESAATLFGDLPDGPGYAVTLTGQSDQIYGRWVTDNLQSASGASPSQGVAIPVPSAGRGSDGHSGTEILFGFLPVTNNFISGPVVVNVGDQAADITLTFYDETGNLAGTTTISNAQPLAPFARVANALVNDTTADLYMIARSSQPLTGVAFVFNSVFNEPAIGNAIAIDSSAMDTGAANLHYAWVSNRDGQFESNIIVNNYGNQSANLTLTARRADGSNQTINREVLPNGFLKESASSLFAELGSGGGYAVTCQADSAKVTGVWVTNNLEAASGASPSQGVAVNFTNLSASSSAFGKSILFGYLPISDSVFSAPAIVNLGSSATNVALTFYNSAGQQLLQDTTTIQGLTPLQPFAAVANNLLPAGTGNVQMVATSGDQPLTGVVFVFNSDKEPALGNATAIQQ